MKVSYRGVPAFLKETFKKDNWDIDVERRFLRFYTESFNSDALLENVPQHSSENSKKVEREMDVMKRWWGIGVKQQTLQSIGDEQSVSGGRIGQIKNKATRKMKHPSRKNIIRGNLAKMGFFF